MLMTALFELKCQKIGADTTSFKELFDEATKQSSCSSLSFEPVLDAFAALPAGSNGLSLKMTRLDKKGYYLLKLQNQSKLKPQPDRNKHRSTKEIILMLND